MNYDSEVQEDVQEDIQIEENNSNEENWLHTDGIIRVNLDNNDSTSQEHSTHSYLGTSRELGFTSSLYFEEDSLQVLPLVCLADVVIFPGDTLPLRIISSQHVRLLQQLISSENHHIAVFNLHHLCGGSSELRVGTIARILATCDDARGSSMIAQGTQRCSLIDSKQSERGLLLGEIKIRTDLHGINPPLEINSLFSSTYWTKSIYNLYNAEILVKRAQNYMKECNTWSSLGCSSSTCSHDHQKCRNILLNEKQDPTIFSYWLCANLPIESYERQYLLNLDCTVARLRKILKILKKSTGSLYCFLCKTEISNKADIFCMLNEGTVGNFVNNLGYVHQIITLKRVIHENISLGGAGNIEDTWFPGYSWAIMYCATCQSHLGWQFNAYLPNLTIPYFYGIRRSCLTHHSY